MGRYKEWKEYFQTKNKYSQNFPHCFYDLAGKYLPKDNKAVIIDVGCGRLCVFETYLDLWNKYKNLILLERNKNTINEIKIKHKKCNILEYSAPDNIPLDDKSVDYIYCSHMIEHLYFMDVYKLLKEFDRILKPNGILAIRSPLLWYGFYQTFDHIKPYPPTTFIQYLCKSESEYSYKPISKDYEVKEVAYRYITYLSNQDNRLGSSIKIFDFLIQSLGRISRIFKIRRYRPTGYTLILRKK